MNKAMGGVFINSRFLFLFQSNRVGHLLFDTTAVVGALFYVRDKQLLIPNG